MSGAVPSRFRRRVTAGESLVGAFVNLGSSSTAEIMAIGGFDWLVIDLEHGAGDEQQVFTQLQAIEGAGVAALVRVEAIDQMRFQRVLDLGAVGVLAPMLRSAEDARRCVDFCRYARNRGVAKHNRSWQWTLATGSLADADDQVVCAVQIETAEALREVDQIAAVEGVDVLFVGPGDLAHSLGMDCGPDHPDLRAEIAKVAVAAKRHGKAAGIFVNSIELASAYQREGFNFLGCSSDSSLLAHEARRVAEGLHSLVQGSVTTPLRPTGQP